MAGQGWRGRAQPLFEGSAALAAELGDREWSRAIEAHDRTLGEVVARHGGRVIKTLGSGALVSFGAAPEFTFGDPFPVELKGLDGSHELVPVTGAPVASA